MFNKKLKQKIAELRSDNQYLGEALLEMSEKLNKEREQKEAAEVENKSLQDVIEAQAIIIAAFSGFIVSLDKGKKVKIKKGNKDGKKSKRTN